MPVVSVRIDDADEDWLRRRNLKPGAFARVAVHEAIRRMEIKESREFLQQHTVCLDRPSLELIREDRDRP